MFIIVSREQSAQYAYRKHLFEKEAIDVILDRRAGERRQLVATIERGPRGAAETAAKATSPRTFRGSAGQS